MFDLIGTIKKKSGVDDLFGDGMNVPKSVQDVIKIDTVYADGMFAVGKDKYRKEINEMLTMLANGANAIVQDKNNHLLMSQQVVV